DRIGKTVSQMHCLYCDRPLALLKRLTGDGEFCSKEHRKIYQKEHNQLALARLLEAQPKPKEKPRSSSLSNSKPAERIEVEPAKETQERQPEPAGFISDFLQEASAVSDAHRSTGSPKFDSPAPVWDESHLPPELRG